MTTIRRLAGLAACALLGACNGFSARLSTVGERPTAVGFESGREGYDTRCVVRVARIGDYVVLRPVLRPWWEDELLLARLDGATLTLADGQWSRLANFDVDGATALVDVLERVRTGRVLNRVPASAVRPPAPAPTGTAEEPSGLETMVVTGSRVRRYDEREEAAKLIRRLHDGALPEVAVRTDSGIDLLFGGSRLTLISGPSTVDATIGFIALDSLPRSLPHRPLPIHCPRQ